MLEGNSESIQRTSEKAHSGINNEVCLKIKMGISVCFSCVRKEKDAYATFGLGKCTRKSVSEVQPSGSERSGTGSNSSEGLSDTEGRRSVFFLARLCCMAK